MLDTLFRKLYIGTTSKTEPPVTPRRVAGRLATIPKDRTRILTLAAPRDKQTGAAMFTNLSVAQLEQKIIAREGQFHVLGKYCPAPGQAAIERRRAAERQAREAREFQRFIARNAASVA